MKLTEILTEWKAVVKNLDGKEKRFSSHDSPEALAWKNSKTEKRPETDTARWNRLEREERAAERARNKKPSLDEICTMGENAIGNTFPDGDPMDHLSSWMRNNNVTMDDLNKAFKKKIKREFYQYLGDMWEDFALDQMHDVKRDIKKHGRVIDKNINTNSTFFDYDDDKGTVELNANPWWSREEQAKIRAKYKD